jgi:hypothetical protein
MASPCQVTRELVTDLPVQVAASGFLAGALHVRPAELTGAVSSSNGLARPSAGLTQR